MNWNLQCHDAAEFLSGLSPESSKLILTDVPYGVTTEPFDVRLTYTEIKKVAREMKRVLTPDGGVFLFLNYKQLADWERGLYSAGFRTFRTGVWLKSNGLNNAVPYPSNSIEHWIYTTRNNQSENQLLPVYLSASGQANKAHEKIKIPFRKPISLMRTLILNHSNEHDVVVDPFCGSGSVGISALLENRHVELNDIDPDKMNQIEENLKHYNSYSIHKPKEEFLADKKERRGSGYDGLTDEEANERILNKVKFNRGQTPERRKSNMAESKASGKKDQMKLIEDEAKTKNKPKSKSRPAFSLEQQQKILAVIVKHNYESPMKWSEFAEEVRQTLGRKRAPARDRLLKASKSIVRGLGKVKDGELLSLPAHKDADVLKSSFLQMIAGKKPLKK